jgi:nucleotide-binding universal stress UspA family protein
VVLTTDFSECARRTLDCIPALKAMGFDEVVLLHVINPHDLAHVLFGLGSDQQLAQIRTRVESILAETAEQTKQWNLPVRPVVKFGKAADGIIATAREESAQLITIGSQGWGLVKGTVLGSVSERVLRHAPMPVMVLKCGPKGAPEDERCDQDYRSLFRRIMLPTDFSEASLEARDYVLELAEHVREAVEEVIVIHVAGRFTVFSEQEYQEAPAELRRVARSLEAAGYRVRTLLKRGVPFVQLAAAVREEGVTLVVMGSHGLSRVREMLLGGTCAEFVRTVDRPVLVVKRDRLDHIV